MSILSREKKGGDFEAARQRAINFCSHSNNSSEELQSIAEEFKAFGLAREQISDIRMLLPVYCGGTTGQKALRVDRVLKRLEKELL